MTKKFTELQQKIVDYVTANPKCNGAEIQKAVTGSVIGNIYPTLNALVKKGVLIKLRNKRYMINHAYTLKHEAKGTNLERIKREIEAYRLANEAAKYRTPQQLRDLVIHSLVQVVIDPDAKHAQRVQAAKVLGTVTEVAAFTERREVTHIKTAEDARAALMAKLHEVMKAGAVDVEARAVDSLLAEIVGPEPGNDTEAGNVANDALQPMQDDDAMSGAHAMNQPDGDPAAVDFAGDESATPTAPNAVRSPSISIHTKEHTESPKNPESPPPVIDSVASLESELSGNTPVSKTE